MIVISTGCPAGIGPEVAVRAAAALRGVPRVLVGDEGTLLAAAELCGVSARRIRRLVGGKPRGGGIYIHPAGPKLGPKDRAPGSPTAAAGAAQLAYIDEAYALCKRVRAPLVTGPVSKAAIARSGSRRAKSFRGHTEWLQTLDGAGASTMCFASSQLVTALVTTHIPLKSVSPALTAEKVRASTCHLARLIRRIDRSAKPKIVVASLNPHAGESELLGSEEKNAIIPGIAQAKKKLYGKAKIYGPLGAETAFRLAAAGEYQGVVAMYHDQATIPMKLLAFGEAVNVTMGLSLVRTSVDHGTAYDLAWQGKADPNGMIEAIKLAEQLVLTKSTA